MRLRCPISPAIYGLRENFDVAIYFFFFFKAISVHCFADFIYCLFIFYIMTFVILLYYILLINGLIFHLNVGTLYFKINPQKLTTVCSQMYNLYCHMNISK